METINVDGYSFRLIVQHKNNRHTYLRVKDRNTLVVYTNHRTHSESIHNFIQSNSRKIVKYLEQQPQKIHPIFSDLLFYQGHFYPISYQSSLKSLWDWDEKTLIIRSREDHRTAILDFYRTMTVVEVKQLAERWIDRLQPYVALNPINFKAQLMKSQFGSCQTEKRIIKFNSILACFDPSYLEIIFLHEVMHLKYPNHGDNFYQLLLYFCPDYRQKRKELSLLFKSIEVS